MKLVTITTESGSRYNILEDSQGEYFLRAENVENPNSIALDPEIVWKIEQPAPWPIEVGKPVLLAARQDILFDSPRRIPGGGKVTSPVLTMREIS